MQERDESSNLILHGNRGNEARASEASAPWPQMLDRAVELSRAATIHERLARYEEAEPLYREALAIFQQVLPEGHPDIATSLNNLAALLYITGRYGEAEPLYCEALAIRKQALPKGHPSIANSLNDLAGAKSYVQEMIAGYIQDCLDIGVVGFRVDAAKHMWPEDIKNTIAKVINKINPLVLRLIFVFLLLRPTQHSTCTR